MLTITPVDETLPHDDFKLSWSPTKPDFGYRKTGVHGYVVQLIINGKIKREKVAESLPTDISLNSYFGYRTNVGDTVQIGIRTWVIDDTGKKIFNSDGAKCSNPIHMSTKPVKLYLKRK